MYPKENIGTEVHFPKGNKSSAPLKIDVAIFDNDSWFSHYNEY
jgi:type I restriction enzyme M protein